MFFRKTIYLIRWNRQSFIESIKLCIFFMLFILFLLANNACQFIGQIDQSGQRPLPEPAAVTVHTLNPIATPHIIIQTSNPMPTLLPKRPALPATTLGLFHSKLIESKGYISQEYISNPCEYIKTRWSAGKAAPGSIVLPVMFHSIVSDDKKLSADGSQIHRSYFDQFMELARQNGFTTITTEQLVNFLYDNTYIPPRSMILILDDRRVREARIDFMPYLQQYGWTVTMGWIIGDTDKRQATYMPEYPDENYPSLWAQIEAYYRTGRVDPQAHGYIHEIPITDDSSQTFMNHEIIDSRVVLQQHFYCKDQISGKLLENCQSKQPLAYIWPGGGFSKTGAEIARQAGYKLGFTIFPRGPLMYNWIPQGDNELKVADPLMTLPRYWSEEAIQRMNDVIKIGQDAAAFAAQYKNDELNYYDTYCKDQLGPIPGQ